MIAGFAAPRGFDPRAPGSDPTRSGAVRGPAVPPADVLLARLARPAKPGELATHAETNENRRLLLAFIREHPGLNIQELADSLSMQRTAARYHIRRMVRDSAVVARKQGHEVLHFPPHLPDGQRKVLALLRVESVRKVALALQDNPRASWDQLAEQLATTTRTVRRAIRALKRDDLLRLEKDPTAGARVARLHPDLRVVLARWQPNGIMKGPHPDAAVLRTRDGNNPLM